MFLDFALVCTRVHIEALGPCLGYQFDEVVVAGGILGQHYEVPSYIALVHMGVQVFLRHVHLAAEYGLKRMLLGIRQRRFGIGYGLFVSAFARRVKCRLGLVKRLAVLLVYIIEEFLDAIHIAVVSESDAGHSVIHGLVDKRRYRCLPVK